MCLALQAPGRVSNFITEKEISLIQVVICSFSQHSPRTWSVPSLVLGIRDGMENETQVLPLQDGLVGSQVRKQRMTAQDGEGPAAGRHRGHTVEQLPMQPREREPLGSFPKR